MAVKPIPDGYHSVTPYLIVKDADRLLTFLKSAFGAQELHPPMRSPEGTVHHAEIKIGDSAVMLSEGNAQHPPMPVMLYLYVEDVDAVFKQAVDAGGKPTKEPENQFYGDRNGCVEDHCGNQWWIGTHVEDVPPDEMCKRAQAAHAEKCS